MGGNSEKAAEVKRFGMGEGVDAPPRFYRFNRKYRNYRKNRPNKLAHKM